MYRIELDKVAYNRRGDTTNVETWERMKQLAERTGNSFTKEQALAEMQGHIGSSGRAEAHFAYRVKLRWIQAI